MANIIIDTNIFRQANFNLNSASFRILDKYLELFEQEKAKLIIPNIILQEIIKVYKKDLDAKYSAYESSIKKLLKVQYIDDNLTHIKIDIDEQIKIFEKRFKKELNDRFGEQLVIENEAKFVDIKILVKKCINGEPPFSQDGKLGFRDAVIWEVVKNYVNNNMEKTIFISNDSDFINKETKKIHTNLLKELKNEIIVLNDLSELDLKLIIDKEKTKLIHYYAKALEDNALEEILKEFIDSNISDYVRRPIEYDNIELTFFNVNNINIIDIIKYNNNNLIIKVDFNLNLSYDAYIFKYDYYPISDNPNSLGDFEMIDSDWNESMMLASTELEYNISTLLTYNIDDEEIESIEIIDKQRKL